MNKKAILNSAFILAACLFGFVSQASADPVFGANVRIDNTGISQTKQLDPAIAIDTNKNVYAVWSDWRAGTAYGDVYFAKSTDGGATFGANVKVNDASTSYTTTLAPAIAVDRLGRIYVAWQDRRSGAPHIYFSKSTDGGATFSANIRLDDSGAFAAYSPTMMTDWLNKVYVAWHDYRSSTWNITLVRSTDGGATFSANNRVDTNGGNSPSLVFDPLDGYTCVAWRSSNSPDIYFAKSTVPEGITFSTNVKVNSTTPTGIGTPSLAITRVGADNYIYITWHDRRSAVTNDIYLAKSIDGGATFGTDLKVNDVSGGSEFPSIAANAQGEAYIAWQDTRNGAYNIYLAKSTDNGATFGTSVRLNDVTSGSQYPSMSIDSERNVFVTWQDSRNNEHPDIYAVKGLEQWSMNIPNVPWYENIATYFSTGAATSQMILNYIRTGAGLGLLNQNEIYEYAKSPSPYGPDLLGAEVDKALDHFHQGPYNFAPGAFDPVQDPTNAMRNYMRDICFWMSYSVPNVTRPNIPVAAPLMGTYNHWAVLKGFITNSNPWSVSSSNLIVYGFWIKDPLVTGIGQDTYKTAEQCAASYFLPLVTTDGYNGLLLSVREPPQGLQNAPEGVTVELDKPKEDLGNLAFIGVNIESLVKNSATLSKSARTAKLPVIAKKKDWSDILPTALLADADCKAAFTRTLKGQAMLVKNANTGMPEYYLLPFKKRDLRKGYLTSAVIILDANKGSFRETAWTKNPEKFLKIDENDAKKLIFGNLIIDRDKRISMLSKTPHSMFLKQRAELHRSYDLLHKYVYSAKIELLWAAGNKYSTSPYRPYWRIDANGYVWIVTQEGKVISQKSTGDVINEISTNKSIIANFR